GMLFLENVFIPFTEIVVLTLRLASPSIYTFFLRQIVSMNVQKWRQKSGQQQHCHGAPQVNGKCYYYDQGKNIFAHPSRLRRSLFKVAKQNISGRINYADDSHFK